MKNINNYICDSKSDNNCNKEDLVELQTDNNNSMSNIE
jgi:hypothetical protein